MAWSYEQIVAAEAEKWNAEYAAGNAAMEQARLVEDEYALREATERMYRAEQNLLTLNAKVEATRRAQQAQMPASFEGLTREQTRLALMTGLTGEQAQIALNASADPRLDDADKMQLYREGLDKYRDWRAAGNKDDFDLQGKNHPGRR